MRSNGATLAADLVLALAWLLPPCACAEGFEPPRDLPAEEVVSPELRSGDGYSIVDPAHADGFAMRYTVASPAFGSFEATSDYMLPVRIQEVRALGALEEVSRSEAFKEAAVNSAKTPFRVIGQLATRPGETLEGAGRGAKKAAKKVGGWLGGDRRTRADAENSAFNEAVGFSRRKRKLAHALSVDVYSSNEKLQEELDRVCWASVSGGLSFGALMAVVPIPPVLELTRQTTGFTAGLNDLMATKSGGDLYRINREILRGMGMTDAETEPFLDNPKASPRHKTFTVAAIEEMRGVAGLKEFVAAGREVGSEEEALRLQRVAELARGHHAKVSPLREIVRVEKAILLLTEGDELVALLPADRLLWTEETRDLAVLVSDHAAARSDVEGRQIWITGVFSDRSRDELSDRGFELHEHAGERLESD